MPSIIVASAASGIGLLFFFLFLLVYLALIVWTYSDAQQNSTHPAFLWALVVFFAPLLGLVLYVLLGRDARGTTRRSSAAGRQY